ncbi:MAG: hypothetical protein MRJ93_04730 [Nitrososphaeraceae archaeon]|nr:hypothetical protein [Nitrososphaeraceae archaeon]
MRIDAEDNIDKIKLALVDTPLAQKELCEKTGLNRDTVRNYGKMLINQGILVRDGKFGKYRFAENINIDLSKSNSKNRGYRYKTLNNILKWKINHKRPNKFTTIEIPDRELFSNDMLFKEIVLYEFSNKIAGYILYILIKAFESEKQTVSVNGFRVKEIKMKERDRGSFREKWISDLIDPKTIFKQFCKLGFVREGLRQEYVKSRSLNEIQKRITKEIIESFSDADKERFKQDTNFINSIHIKAYQDAKEEYNYYNNKYSKTRNLSNLEMNEENYNLLINAFKNVFPDIFKELESRKFHNTKPRDIDMEKDEDYAHHEFIEDSQEWLKSHNQ